MFKTQQHNPLTGDIELNPAAFGLSMKDIDKAASLNLKSALNSGGLSLTADQYRELETISEKKYSALDPNNGNLDLSVLPAKDMTGSNPGLYATHQYIGYWTGDKWSSFIGNNGRFQFQGNSDNFIRWNGSALEIKGVFQMTSGGSLEDYVSTNNAELEKKINDKGEELKGDIDSAKTTLDGKIDTTKTALDGKIDTTRTTLDGKIDTTKTALDGKIESTKTDLKQYVNDNKFSLANTQKVGDTYRQWLRTGDLLPYTIPRGSTGIYFTNAGLFGYNRRGESTFKIDAANGDAFFRGNVHAQSGHFEGNITSSATISGGTILGASIKGGEFLSGTFKTDGVLDHTKDRIHITDANIALWKGGNDYPGLQLVEAGVRFADGNRTGTKTHVDFKWHTTSWITNQYPEIRLDGSLYLHQLRVNGENIYLGATPQEGTAGQVNRGVSLDDYISQRIRSSVGDSGSRISSLESRVSSLERNSGGPTDYVQYIDIANGELIMRDNRGNIYRIKPGNGGYLRGW